MSETLKDKGFRLTYREGDGWNWRQDVRVGDFDATDLSEDSFEWIVRKLEEISNLSVACAHDSGSAVAHPEKDTDDFDLTDNALDEWDRDEDWVHDIDMGAR